MSIAKVEECIYTSYYIYFKFSHGLIFYFISYIKRLFYFCSRIFLTEMQKNMIIEQTEDGIPTLYLPRMDEHYHSTKGALAEARHVYIDSALRVSGKKEINVLEIGFGTGLNTFLTFLESQEKGLRINYTTFELYPLSPDITEKLNYPALIAPSSESIFALLHQCEWNQKIAISPLFSLYKRHADLTRTSPEGIYDVVYFDAFAPEKQPEMWDEKIFREIFNHLSPGGILSTYCAKGEIRRRLQSVGFTVERLPGPPNGKREILRASKR